MNEEGSHYHDFNLSISNMTSKIFFPELNINEIIEFICGFISTLYVYVTKFTLITYTKFQGRHIVKTDLTECPECNFPALRSEFVRLVE